MPRFERKKPAGTLFWEIEPAGASFTIRFGKVGSEDEPTEVVREMPSAFAADKEIKRLIGGKKAEGFLEVEEVPQVEGNPGLEEAIRAEPDAVQPYLVYADWLQAHGDPRGELIVVQHELESAKGDKRAELAARSRSLVQRHSVHLLGELAPMADGVGDLEWRLGFLSRCRIAEAEEELVRGFLAHRSAFVLRHLALDVASPDLDLEPCVVPLTERGGPRPPLVSLALGPEREPDPEMDEFGDEQEAGLPSIGSLSALWRAYPGLASLKVRGVGLTLGTVNAPALRELEVSIELDSTHTNELAKASMPALERLALTVRSGTGRLDWIAKLPKLRELAVRGYGDANALVAKLAASAVGKRLVSLDLTGGSLDDAGAQPILDGAFPACQELNLSRNLIRGVVARELKTRRGAKMDDQEDVEERLMRRFDGIRE